LRGRPSLPRPIRAPAFARGLSCLCLVLAAADGSAAAFEEPLGFEHEGGGGPSLYAFAGNDPVNGRDPLGLREPTPEDLAMQAALEQRLFEFDWAFAETDYAEAEVLETGYKTVWWDPGNPRPFARWEHRTATDLASYQQLRGRLQQDLDTFVAAVAEADDDGAIDYTRESYYTYTRAEQAANARAGWYLAPVVVGDVIAMVGGPFAKAPPGALRVQARQRLTPRPDGGYRSFSAFKRAEGRAGEGYHWHHIVEKTPGNVLRFGPEAVHSTQNLVRLDVATHRRLSAFYSSVRRGVTGSDSLTVRQWLSAQPFEAQAAFGRRALENVSSGVWP
jgi:hypothetical protein